MVDINWVGGIVGGLMIGAASTWLLLFNGRIAGISGIVGQLFVSRLDQHSMWRLFFVIGLIAGAAMYSAASGGLPVQMQADGLLLIIAGTLVGVGTKLGSGCTSGHGVCGIARRSPRSILATLIFITVAILTVFILGQFR